MQFTLNFALGITKFFVKHSAAYKSNQQIDGKEEKEKKWKRWGNSIQQASRVECGYLYIKSTTRVIHRPVF